MNRAGLDKRSAEVAGMFDEVAHRYDLTNDVLSLWQDRAWRRATVRAVGAAPGDMVLDLAAGTGTSSQAFADTGVRVVACDFSLGMLQVAAAQCQAVGIAAGDALALPFASGSFDAVTIAFGLRNVEDVDAALTEMRRVTRPGGRLVICEFSTPVFAPLRVAYDLYLRQVLPRMASLVSSNSPAYGYLAQSIEAWPDQVGLGRALLRAGWSQVTYRNLSGGIVALHRAVA